MSSSSAIEWTDATWNPVTGCDKVSPGCAHCYAEAFAERWRGIPGHPYEQGFDLRLWPERLDMPLRWRRPRMVFVNSMSDLFHEDVPDEYIARVFAVMALARHHTFQVLTKRPERMRAFFAAVVEPDVGWLPGSRALWMIREAIGQVDVDLLRGEQCELYADQLRVDLPLPNVWLGVSIENRRFVHRADVLRETPAAVRFISAEPLLGPLLAEKPGCPSHVWDGPYRMRCSLGGDGNVCARHGKFVKEREGLDLTGIDWLIVGGESGPKHRPIKPEWVRDLRDATQPRCDCRPGMDGGGVYHELACASRGRPQTAFFFKQWGGRTPKSGGRELDGRTWDELPAVATRESVAA